MSILEFEKPIIALRNKIEELKRLQSMGQISLKSEIKRLEAKTDKLETATYSKLDCWQKTQLARHGLRPYTLDFIEYCTSDFVELHGDRSFRDDPAIVGGFCRIDEHPFLVLGHQKGRTTREKVERNFGMPHPEGYRKALRLMNLADKFRLPILTLIDTPGAYPGVGAEERGQSEAIAVNLREMAGLKVPMISVILGEGGSGGALALGVTNRVLMMEHAIYSVISPEGCAGILWGDGSRAEEAAKALKYTAQNLARFRIVDEIIPEPKGGAHSLPEEAMVTLKKVVLKHYRELAPMPEGQLVEDRYRKFRQIGEFMEEK